MKKERADELRGYLLMMLDAAETVQIPKDLSGSGTAGSVYRQLTTETPRQLLRMADEREMLIRVVREVLAKPTPDGRERLEAALDIATRDS